jgi:tetratricopeptide (TPR) repeat protein
MRVAIYTLILNLSILATGFGQVELVNPDLVGYHSQEEKANFHNYFKKAQFENFQFFIASGSLLNESKVNEAKARFEQFVAPYKEEKFRNKKNERKARQIFDDIHKTFLKNYVESSSFEEIFYNGNFGSLSAAALFAIVFEEAGIPFKINYQPPALFLLVETVKITPASTTGFEVLTEEYRANFVRVLKNAKLIPANEAASQSDNVLFNKYYFANQNFIKTLNLLGLQYLEDSQKKFTARSFESAFAQAEKAYLLFPFPLGAENLMGTGTNAFQARKQLDSVKAVQLAKISAYTEQGVTSENIQSEFFNIMNELLFEKGKKEELDRFYDILQRYIQNLHVKKDIEYLYYYEYGRYYNSLAKFHEALPYFEKALTLSPSKIDAVNGYVVNLAGKLSSSSNNIENLMLIEKAASAYPTLLQSNTFNEMRLSTYLIQIAVEYDNQNAQQGEKYRLAFEELAGKNLNSHPNGNLVAQAYSRAAIYYFKKSQTQKARSLIDTGLKFSPNNYELISRQRMLN